MKCRSCGTEIAEKAIVCFRCGTPTDMPALPSRPRPRPRAPIGVGVLVLIVAIALGLWLLPPMLTDGAFPLYIGWAGLVLAAGLTAWLLRRRK
jgi:LPXTG-motif cell wall-anchored protein